jgi:predicted RND superfamily exporter protein
MLTSRDGSQGRRGKWIVAAVAFAIPWCILAVRNLQIQPDGHRRLADTDPTQRLKVWHHAELPRSESLLVTWEGSTANDPRIGRFSEALIGREDADGIRRGGAPEIAAVITPAAMLNRLTAQEIEPEAAIQRLTGTFLGAGGLKLRLTEAGRATREATIARLVSSARKTLGIELQTRGPVEVWAGEDASDTAEEAVEVSIPEHDLQVTWDGFHPQSTTFAQMRALALGLTDFATAEEPKGRKLVEDCFVATGSPVGIQVELSTAGAADVPSALRAIDRAAEAAEIENLHLAGQPITQVEQSRVVANAVWNPSAMKLTQRSLPLLLALVAAGLTCLVVRSLRMGLLLSGISAVAVLLSMALLRVTGADVDPVLLAVPLFAGSLVLAGGLQVSASRFDGDEEMRLREARNRRTAMIIASLVMLPLGISSTPVVRQFGTLGVTAAMFALLLDTLVLPLLLPVVDNGRSRRGENNGPWAGIAESISRRPRLIGVLCSLLLVAGAAGLSRLRIEADNVRLQPADSRLSADEQFIEDNLSGTTPLDLVVRFDVDSLNSLRFVERAEIVRAAESAVQQHPAVTGTLSMADLLPVIEVPAANAPTRQRVLFARRSNEVEEQVKSGQIVGSASLLFTADRAADWQVAGDERLSRAGDELWRISTNAMLPPDVDVQQVTHEIDASIQEVLRQHPGADHVLAGPSVYAAATRTVMLKSQSKTLLLAAVMVIGALIWTLRTPTAILIGLVVNVLPIACALGIAALRGVQLDVEGMVAALLALGLSAQASLRLLLSFRDGIQAGESHVAAMRRALAERGAGNWRFAIVAIGMAFVLTRTDITSLRSFGALLAAMIATTQFTAMILLPALLAGRIGRWLEQALRGPGSAVVANPEVIKSPHVRFEPAARDVVRPAV